MNQFINNNNSIEQLSGTAWIESKQLSANDLDRIKSDARDVIRGIRDNKTKDAIYKGYINGATSEALRQHRWVKESDFNILREMIYCTRSVTRSFGYIYHSLFIDINGMRWVDGTVNSEIELEILDESATPNNDVIIAALRKFISMHETGLLPDKFTYEAGKKALDEWEGGKEMKL